ncbi:unnamed protein product [Rotaria socialis]|uniref:Uncharacterized protein n=1 Tax=Rotaria socialis TaxID=392032 RepID=A0A817KZ79_9BILA|nr:unnamed protein product [Rotaria socialis]
MYVSRHVEINEPKNERPERKGSCELNSNDPIQRTHLATPCEEGTYTLAYALFENTLNNLLLSIKHRRLIIDETESHELISALAPHVGLLTVNTWDDIDLHKFRNLYSLKLARPTQIQLKQIRADTMPNLTYLSLSPNVYFSAPKQLISDAFSGEFRHLRWARFGHIDSYDPLCRFQSLSLRYLHIGCYHTTLIPFVLATCPNLQQLNVDCLRSGDKTMYSPAMIDNHLLQQIIGPI